MPFAELSPPSHTLLLNRYITLLQVWFFQAIAINFCTEWFKDEFGSSSLQTFTNSKPVVEPEDVCCLWIVQYLKHASFHFAAVNSENTRTWMLCFVFATLENDVTFHPYLENKVYIFINRFHATGIFLYPLKTSETRGFLCL